MEIKRKKLNQMKWALVICTISILMVSGDWFVNKLNSDCDGGRLTVISNCEFEKGVGFGMMICSWMVLIFGWELYRIFKRK